MDALAGRHDHHGRDREGRQHDEEDECDCEDGQECNCEEGARHAARDPSERGLASQIAAADAAAEPSLQFLLENESYMRWEGRQGGDRGFRQQQRGAMQRSMHHLQLLFTDRDFDQHDYEMLLALDDTITNRRGVCDEGCQMNIVVVSEIMRSPLHVYTFPPNTRCPKRGN